MLAALFSQYPFMFLVGTSPGANQTGVHFLLEQSFVAQIGGHDPRDCLLVGTATPG